MEEKKKQRHLVHNLALAATRQVWMAPVMEERKKRGCQIPIPTLAAIEQARMVPATGSPSPHVHNTWHRMEVLVLSHQKSDATSTCFGFWLKEEKAPFLPY